MRLSDHFTLEEMTRSQTAVRKGIDNQPGPVEIENLRHLCVEILEPVRAHFRVPFSPSSGYRCLELNRAIRSRDTSQHISGEAVDFELPGVANSELAHWIAENLDYDQLILEFFRPGVPSSGWVHCSLVRGTNRMMTLTIGPEGVRPGLVA